MMKCAVIIGLGLSLVISAPAHAARSPCKATVVERLKDLNVDPLDISKITYVARRNSMRGGGGPVIGFEAWVSLRSCKGNLVVKLSRNCRIRKVYGRGECEPGG